MDLSNLLHKVNVLFNPSAALESAAWQQQTKPVYAQESGSMFSPASQAYVSPVPTGESRTTAELAQLQAERQWEQSQSQPSSGGNVGSFPSDQYAGWDPTAAQADWEAKGGQSGGQPDYAAEARGAIESGYGDYFAQLDAMMNEGLPSQKTSQEELARQQYTGGINALQPQLQAGQTQLTRQRERTSENQAKNLRDLSANLRNAFMAGNVFLGARGAGDSSAANQYSYALTKLGSRQRSDVMTQSADIMREIGDREANLTNIYNAETNRLASERDQKITGIASWFAEQQNALRQAKAQGAVSKGQDLATLSQNLLNAALSELGRVQTEASNRRSALEQWALNNSNSIAQVKSNLQAVGAFQPNMPQSQPIVGQPSVDAGGNVNTMAYGYGQPTTEEEKRNSLFNNPNWFS